MRLPREITRPGGLRFCKHRVDKSIQSRLFGEIVARRKECDQAFRYAAWILRQPRPHPPVRSSGAVIGSGVQLKQMQEGADVHSAAAGQSAHEMIEEADANLLVVIKDMREAVKAAEQSNDPGPVLEDRPDSRETRVVPTSDPDEEGWTDGLRELGAFLSDHNPRKGCRSGTPESALAARV